MIGVMQRRYNNNVKKVGLYKYFNDVNDPINDCVCIADKWVGVPDNDTRMVVTVWYIKP